jgi:uncharacterized protein YecE (DUF72 family)
MKRDNSDPASLTSQRTPEGNRAGDEPKIVLGTSGWSFKDWVGTFYPQGTERAHMLGHYVKEFPAVEVNSTYYRIPHWRTFEAIAKKTPPRFEIVVKTHHDITHRRSREPQLYSDFERSIRPLREAGKLTGILAQFPYGFRRTFENEQFLRALPDLLGNDVPLFVEFRHRSWVDEDVFQELQEEGLGYVSVDEPDLPGLVPPIARRTGPVGYVRFHGRNKEKWWSAESRQRGAPDRPPRPKKAESRVRAGADLGPLFSGTPEHPAEAPPLPQAPSSEPRTSSTRYDYSYTEDELREWVDKIREMTQQAKKTFVFFNNCHVGQAATSAKLMRKLLEGEGML